MTAREHSEGQAARSDILPVPARSHNDIAQELEDVRHALQWALTHIECIDEERGEVHEDYAGATRLAWPDDPAQWA